MIVECGRYLINLAAIKGVDLAHRTVYFSGSNTILDNSELKQLKKHIKQYNNQISFQNLVGSPTVCNPHISNSNRTSNYRDDGCII